MVTFIIEALDTEVITSATFRSICVNCSYNYGYQPKLTFKHSGFYVLVEKSPELDGPIFSVITKWGKG